MWEPWGEYPRLFINAAHRPFGRQLFQKWKIADAKLFIFRDGMYQSLSLCFLNFGLFRLNWKLHVLKSLKFRCLIGFSQINNQQFVYRLLIVH